MNLLRNLAVELMLILGVTFEGTASDSEFKPIGERCAEKTDNKLDAGDPLYLTPLLDAGQAEEARLKAKVTHPDLLDIESYAGYFKVANGLYRSNVFFWYFPAKENPTTAPVVLYLEGGPSLTTLFSLSLLNGPFSVNGSLKVEPRKESWNNKQHLIYIDSPMGTGYSFIDEESGLPPLYWTRQQSQFEHISDLAMVVDQFFELFPSLRKNDFFVAGQDHAGKIVPLLTSQIHFFNELPGGAEKINLKGMAISNGYTDPINQLIYSEYFYKIGLVDANGRDKLRAWENEIRFLIGEDKHEEAYRGVQKLFHGKNSLLRNLTGYTHFFNVLRTEERFDFGCPLEWVQRPDVRRALHVGNTHFNATSKAAMEGFKVKETTSEAKTVAEILENYQVLIYTGNLGLICPYFSVQNYLKNLTWSGANEFKTAERKLFQVASGELAGYIKKGGNLTEVLIRNAGHLTSFDQPQWTLELIEKFTHGLL